VASAGFYPGIHFRGMIAGKREHMFLQQWSVVSSQWISGVD